jgi:hypothetical protein
MLDFKVNWDTTIYLTVLKEPVKARFLFANSTMEYLIDPHVSVRIVTSPRL